ncbi:uncharacterized protein METZ01_LOCUS330198, partial [marine metagenome]
MANYLLKELFSEDKLTKCSSAILLIYPEEKMIDLIHHVGIVVHSADRALEFFRDIMGLEVTVDKVIEEQGVRGVLLAV